MHCWNLTRVLYLYPRGNLQMKIEIQLCTKEESQIFKWPIFANPSNSPENTLQKKMLKKRMMVFRIISSLQITRSPIHMQRRIIFTYIRKFQHPLLFHCLWYEKKCVNVLRFLIMKKLQVIQILYKIDLRMFFIWRPVFIYNFTVTHLSEQRHPFFLNVSKLEIVFNDVTHATSRTLLMTSGRPRPPPSRWPWPSWRWPFRWWWYTLGSCTPYSHPACGTQSCRGRC